LLFWAGDIHLILPLFGFARELTLHHQPFQPLFHTPFDPRRHTVCTDGPPLTTQLFESNNAKPRLYWFVARYFKKKGDTLAKIHRPSHAPGVFAREFDLFENFFKIKTGIPWAQRLVRAGTTDKSCFQYQPPVSCRLTN
jgi:hypothetical protein